MSLQISHVLQRCSYPQPEFWVSPFTLWQWAVSSWGGQLISDFLLQSSRCFMIIPHPLHLHCLGWMGGWKVRVRWRGFWLGRKEASEREGKEGNRRTEQRKGE